MNVKRMLCCAFCALFLAFSAGCYLAQPLPAQTAIPGATASPTPAPTGAPTPEPTMDLSYREETARACVENRCGAAEGDCLAVMEFLETGAAGNAAHMAAAGEKLEVLLSVPHAVGTLLLTRRADESAPRLYCVSGGAVCLASEGSDGLSINLLRLYGDTVLFGVFQAPEEVISHVSATFLTGETVVCENSAQQGADVPYILVAGGLTDPMRFAAYGGENAVFDHMDAYFAADAQWDPWQGTDFDLWNRIRFCAACAELPYQAPASVSASVTDAEETVLCVYDKRVSFLSTDAWRNNNARAACLAVRVGQTVLITELPGELKGAYLVDPDLDRATADALNECRQELKLTDGAFRVPGELAAGDMRRVLLDTQEAVYVLTLLIVE